ncbi:MAG: hemolysin family protein [Chloroflexota bacterium]|nr:hemolysin [Chloroflexota bacterium]MEC8959764.1 hemolysin family protein [Chloroflexota bacterium]|tara:strand:- start:6628 stop:7920 length:1293 start_codon:yes stop_codon:yes gene_type:complete
MDAGDLWRLALLAVCLGLSGFFSASETAFIALPRARLMHLVRSGRPGAERVSHIIQRPERFLATVLLGNNLVNTAAAALATVLALNLITNKSLSVLAATGGVTAFLLLFGETLPKNVAWRRSERVAFVVSRPIRLVELALSPLVTLLQLFTTMTNRLLGISAVTPQMGEEEIRTLIAAGAQTGTVEAGEAALLEKVFRFGDRQMREIMTPRPEIVWTEQGDTLKEFLEVYSEHSHTRFPVYDGTIENVLGVLSVKDVLANLEIHLENGSIVTNQLRPALFVPETKSVSETFAVMQKGGHSVVLTVDEFGGIAGLATLKQMMAVIVGQMGEEGLAPEEAVTALGLDSFRMDAGLAISDINEELDLKIPEGDYQTLAGFILDRLGRIPEEGDVMEYGDLRFTIKVMERVRIEEVELRRLHSLTTTNRNEAGR